MGTVSNGVSSGPGAGRVVAITGAGRGIGKAAATAFAAAGAQVAIGDLDYGSVQRVASAINHTVTLDGGGLAVALGLDVRDRESWRRFLEEARSDFGPVDVVVNCAGVMPTGPLLEEDEDSARDAFDVNVGGTLAGIKSALPDMVERSSGHIVTVASYMGLVPGPERVTYGASKSAVMALTRGARSEFRGTGVAFTTVVPTTTDTDQVGEAIVRAVESRARTVYVPGRARPIGSAVGVLPQGLRRRIYRAIEAKSSAGAE